MKDTLENKKAIFCIRNGHSNIIETCFGYIHCARCGDQIGDSLGSTYENPNAVIVGHRCKICGANFKKLKKTDFTYVPKSKIKQIIPTPRKIRGEK